MADKNTSMQPGPAEETVSAATQEDVAAYVATLARDLKRLVSRHDLATLTYLLELVQLEAVKNSGEKREQLN